ncbi:hypothetical protein AMS68_006359 [Peltaster fructicola]|uniref:Isochorismatase-like domain-containing protein n=1 Tax=Peltaster fructicola TaxID=286661 RepID=A0A6H0Y1C7_9PEZI|nr:hypothetical protein AMS68_006359 [Peltaster fructicola]
MANNEHDGNAEQHRKAIIGNSKDFWYYSSRHGFDLTHSSSEASEHRVSIDTSTLPVTVDPAKTALVIIDMQNFFLSPAFDRDVHGAGHKAMKQLAEHAIPAARRAGIRVVWLNWGLTQQEVDDMPPAITRAFGFEAVVDESQNPSSESIAVDRQGIPRQQGANIVLQKGKDAKIYKGLGHDCGILLDPTTGQENDAGKLLMRDQWNAALCQPLDKMYEEGLKLESRPDVLVHKNRMSGMWGARTELEDFLEKEGIKTLLFAGVNTDQCVAGTLQDAFSKGYDCILLHDGAGTTSPDFAQECIAFNSARSWGFVASCMQFAEGVAKTFNG